MNMHKKHQRGDNSKSIKVRALIFVCDISSGLVLHNCEVSSKYSKRFSSYRADTKMFTDGQTDLRLIAISPKPFGRGIKTINFPFGTNGKLMVLGIPILQNFSVSC